MSDTYDTVRVPLDSYVPSESYELVTTLPGDGEISALFGLTPYGYRGPYMDLVHLLAPWVELTPFVYSEYPIVGYAVLTPVWTTMSDLVTPVVQVNGQLTTAQEIEEEYFRAVTELSSHMESNPEEQERKLLLLIAEAVRGYNRRASEDAVELVEGLRYQINFDFEKDLLDPAKVEAALSDWITNYRIGTFRAFVNIKIVPKTADNTEEIL